MEHKHVRYKIELSGEERAAVVDTLVDYLNGKHVAIKCSYLEVRDAIGGFASDLVTENNLAVAYEALHNEQSRVDWLGNKRAGKLAESLYDKLPEDVRNQLKV